MNNPLVSIIIPVFNAERYINKCVESVLAQTFIDFELLLIDDGSTDNTAQIIDIYPQSDDRILVFHKKNSGASATRNFGLSQARGRWIVFVDSDDYVGEKYLEDLINKAESKSLVFQGLTKVSEGRIVEELLLEDSIYEGNDIIQLLEKKYFFDRGFPVAKVFDRELLLEHRINFYDVIHYSEDLIFMLEYVKYVKKVITVSGSNYFYQINASQLTRRYNSFASEYELYNKFSFLTSEIAKDYGSVQSETAQKLSALMLMRSIYAMYVNDEYDVKDRIFKVRTVLAEHRSLIGMYYRPQILLLKFAKKLLLYSPELFHVFCRLKFSR